jgi:hypothetical protein
MSSQLKVTTEQKAEGAYIIYPSGSLNSNTFQIFEEKLDDLLQDAPNFWYLIWLSLII